MTSQIREKYVLNPQLTVTQSARLRIYSLPDK